MSTVAVDLTLPGGVKFIKYNPLIYSDTLMVSRESAVYREIPPATAFTPGAAEFKISISHVLGARILFNSEGNSGGEKVHLIYKTRI